ncbi:MOSC domain-containing protein [Streptomyces sp. NBC_01465]|uniref:MOSC domain-containing protein n=1 Tax=Streptomyces sp. NBC_01465 TaxID=2903878 RepID=UPI002E354417|nr:MOSC N-terminal beta barrel domain-containing protein [Streptomyces sp. NBC_01465]
MITVRELYVYPVKGCAKVAVASARVGDMGLKHDRTFMVVDAVDGSFRSQRKLPGMAVVRVEVLRLGRELMLSAPGVESLRVGVDPDGVRLPVSLFDRPVGDGVDQGDAAAEWFSEVLGAKSRLVRVPPGFDRDGWGEVPGKVGFADAHALSVNSVASLDDLNARIAERGGADPVGLDRFRPNIVLEGSDEPHFEDRIRRMTVGTVQLAYAVRAMRCNVPLVDQVTGRRAGPEPVRTLAGYRREPAYDNKVSFGMKAAVVRGGVLSVGDPVDVTRWEA